MDMQVQRQSVYEELEFLQEENALLRAENAELRRQLAERDAQIVELKAQIEKLNKMVFGKKSEKMPRPQKEIEKQDRIPADPKVTQEKRTARTQTRQQNATQVQINHVLDEAKRRCPNCPDQELKFAGTKRTFITELVPVHFETQEHIQEAWACPCCDHIVSAEGPKRPTEGGQYGPGFMSHVVVSKCSDSIPFYRMAKQFCRIGIPISRSTLCDLFHQAADILTPLHQYMHDLVAASPLVLADETPLPVLDKTLDKTRRGYIWTFLTDDVAYYRFSASRSGETPSEVLGNSQGTLLVDGYTGYNAVTTPEGRDRAGCWAHARRKFFEALQTAPKEAQYMLDQILNLYRVEYDVVKRDIVGKPIHKQLRQKTSGPILDHIKTWAEEQRPQHLPTSPMGRAITYMLNQWDPLRHYLTDAKIPIDNNLSERRLRLIALGRKNYLFAGNDAAAENLALLQSMVVTCDMNGVNSEVWLKDVLIRIQTHPNKDIADLLPHRWKDLFGSNIPNSFCEPS